MLIYHTFKKISVCSKAFVECMNCFGEFKEASYSSFESEAITFEASRNTKNLKKTCIRSIWHLTLWAPKILDILVVLNFIV